MHNITMAVSTAVYRLESRPPQMPASFDRYDLYMFSLTDMLAY